MSTSISSVLLSNRAFLELSRSHGIELCHRIKWSDQRGRWRFGGEGTGSRLIDTHEWKWQKGILEGSLIPLYGLSFHIFLKRFEVWSFLQKARDISLVLIYYRVAEMMLLDPLNHIAGLCQFSWFSWCSTTFDLILVPWSWIAAPWKSRLKFNLDLDIPCDSGVFFCYFFFFLLSLWVSLFWILRSIDYRFVWWKELILFLS